jgi:hypothetical protein
MFENEEHAARRYTQGTSTKPSEVKVLGLSSDKSKALIKHPGGMDHYGWGGCYVSAWVDLIWLTGHTLNNRQVWSCARNEDGPLTKKRAAELCKKYLDETNENSWPLCLGKDRRDLP